MYQKIQFTQYPPSDRPLFVWDGNCGFCHYWVIRWQQATEERVEYARYQEVAERFPDISIEHFRQASQLIEPDGTVFGGPAAIFRTFAYLPTWGFVFRWYDQSQLFRRLIDEIYHWIAGHRPQMYRLTRLLWGKNPRSPQPYWLLYLMGFVLLLFLLLALL